MSEGVENKSSVMKKKYSRVKGENLKKNSAKTKQTLKHSKETNHQSVNKRLILFSEK